jgi:hypothetical protein
LLKSPEDERIFDFYASSQLELIRLDGTVAAIGKPGVIVEASPSPDAQYALIEEHHHPYSYLPTFFESFRERVSVINLKAGAARQLVDKPLEDSIPNIHDAVPTGPRDYQWRSDSPATLFWVEAADGGDPRKQAPIRDSLFLLDAAPAISSPAAPRKLADLPLRFEDVSWGTDRLAVIEEHRWKDRKRIILAVAPGGAAPSPAVTLFEGSSEDRYHDPGIPFDITNAAGKLVLQTTQDSRGIFFMAGAPRPKAIGRLFPWSPSRTAPPSASGSPRRRISKCLPKF